MQKFNQLSLEQRYQIEILFKEGLSQTRIAELIGVHKSTVSRELKRNTGKRGINALAYSARIASDRTKVRHRLKAESVRFNEAMKVQARA